MESNHVRNSIRQIDGDSWLIGGTLVLHRTLSAEKFLWKDTQDGYYYSISQSRRDVFTTELPTNSHIQLVHQGAHVSAVWSLGDAYLKVKLLQDRTKATGEAATLNWLSTKEASFVIPEALHYWKEGDRSYLITSRLSGTTLAKAWRGMHENDKQYYVSTIANACKQMTRWTSHAISGVDGGELADPWLRPVGTPPDYRPGTLQENCKELGMEINANSEFVFFHNDLGPGNILIHCGEHRKIGIIDWELAGYVPLEWIRTKFAVGYGMDCDEKDNNPTEWRLRVEQQLGQEGFPAVTDAWNSWWVRYLSS